MAPRVEGQPPRLPILPMRISFAGTSQKLHVDIRSRRWPPLRFFCLKPSFATGTCSEKASASSAPSRGLQSASEKTQGVRPSQWRPTARTITSYTAFPAVRSRAFIPDRAPGLPWPKRRSTAAGPVYVRLQHRVQQPALCKVAQGNKSVQARTGHVRVRSPAADGGFRSAASRVSGRAGQRGGAVSHLQAPQRPARLRPKPSPAAFSALRSTGPSTRPHRKLWPVKHF
ncbi:hypothetical protein SAMN00790413_05994 [Deinococcus hopiensis KR-140]|uniref:Uncharacterized protein n=1 Tax=Deinococcus hopiensis KR-140 TaxID=695939 RepID=A0A1W1VVU1_9DEIO|nr:hypothetical protein SAMN00790413_05994 [Deinococcus hopiensis KR-140]